MVMLVTLDEAKEHLRVTGSIEDDSIVRVIEDASDAVLRYIEQYDFIASDGSVDLTLMPFAARQATLKLIDSFFRDRGSGEEWAPEHNYLPLSVVALLYPLRHPAMA